MLDLLKLITHYPFIMLPKSSQDKKETGHIFAEKLYALAHDAFTQVDKSETESLLVGFFIDGLHSDFLEVKHMKELQNISGTVQSG